MNSLVLKDSLKVTFVVAIIFIGCCIMGDVVSEPIQIALKSTPQHIKDSQNITLIFKYPFMIPLTMIGTFILSVAMLSYLKHGE